MRHAMFILQPQGQSILPATRLTAVLSKSSADWAKIGITARARTTRLLLNFRMLLRYSNDLRSCVGQTHFAGDQTNDSAECDHQEADPDPRDQREDIGLNNSALIVGGETREVHVQVLVQAPTDGHFGHRLLAGLIEPSLGFHLAQ